MTQPIIIAMIEDDEGHARLIEKNLRRAGIHNEIVPLADGASAIAFLFGSDGSGLVNKGRPLLVLLDLNLPRMDGREVLAEIKSDPKLKTIPVVVLTTSRAEQDVLRSYELQANCYITKPIDVEQFIAVVKSIEDFWFTIVTLPHIA